MIRKLAVGAVALVVAAGGAWAAVKYLSPGSDAPGAASQDKDDDDRLLAAPGRGGEIQIDANGLPRLRNGLWNVTTVTDGVTATAKICLDDAFQNEASLFGLQLNASICTEDPEVTRSGGVFTMVRHCGMGPVRLVSTTEITGDMQRNYKRDTEMVTTGPGLPPQTSHQNETGAFVGRCPTDMSGGDMDMNGARFNARMLLAAGGAVALPTGAIDELDLGRMTEPRPAD